MSAIGQMMTTAAAPPPPTDVNNALGVLLEQVRAVAELIADLRQRLKPALYNGPMAASKADDPDHSLCGGNCAISNEIRNQSSLLSDAAGELRKILGELQI